MEISTPSITEWERCKARRVSMMELGKFLLDEVVKAVRSNKEKWDRAATFIQLVLK